MKYQIFLLSLLIISAVSTEQLNKIQNVSGYFQEKVGQQLNFEFYTGYIPVGDAGQENTSLFFSLTTKQGETIQTTSPDTPVIFWFNGGPGCSSQYGNFLEIGPFEVTESLGLKLRQYAWNKQALIVFTDQPLNVGFSYSPSVNVSSTPQATEYFRKFIKGFYTHFSTLTQNPTYFFGESFAGHYIPDFAHMVVTEKPVQDLNFQGIGIGDGWTHPEKQLQSYSEFLFNAGIISQKTREEVAKKQDEGILSIQAGDYSKGTQAFDSVTDGAQYGNLDQYNIFHYSVNGQQDQATMPYFVDLFNSPGFRTAYGVPDIVPSPFSNCNEDIYAAFSVDISKSYQPQIEYLLNQGIRVLLFNGQLDMIVNTASAQDWINTMKWNQSFHWQNSRKTVWYYPNNQAVIGNYQHYSNFVFVNVYLAGHMVPSDQPEAATIMLETYLDWSW